MTQSGKTAHVLPSDESDPCLHLFWVVTTKSFAATSAVYSSRHTTLMRSLKKEGRKGTNLV